MCLRFVRISFYGNTHTQEIEAWNQQVQADLDAQQEQTRLEQEDVMRHQQEDERQKEDERKEQEKKKPKINDFDEGKMVADHVMPRPSQFAIGKLKSFNFDLSKAQSDDAYGLTKVNDLVALKLVASFKASRNIVPDADITWRQMNVGRNTLLRYMDQCDWPQKHVQSFAHFYFNIEIEPMRSRPNGERVLIAYQAKVRRQWHNDLQ
ncbi:hypothetical protein K443DRAFT_4673 [Laccaria amethystina LaAM-08-1]|uniref:Uncharacterized protein n=1 Tax=Laccaria amethystina LaAM-08-1 TaxID=1095629 RepID=A0A0C9Y8K2_9AGAR|nr:hypothetical protein K443DRAFT_4673 [Laccaria amethystina LaAM-08-1]